MIIKFFNEIKEAEYKPTFTSFPDGQPHVKVDSLKWDYDRAEIHCSIRNPKELFQLLMVFDVVDKKMPTSVWIYWLFGARMDRAIDDNQPSTFEIVKRCLPLARAIHILDVHNPKVLPWSSKIDLSPIVQAVLNDFGDCDIYFPDKGAKDRYGKDFHDYTILCGRKKRDSQTGKLSGFELESGTKTSKRVLILDDICDGGGTFIGQYSVLKELGYEKIGLYTTHGLYTKGMDVLKDFDSIYSTNSFQFGLPTEEGYPTNTQLVVRKWRKGTDKPHAAFSFGEWEVVKIII